MSGVQIFVEDEINPFIGTGVNPPRSTTSRATISITPGSGFFGGGYLYPTVSGGRPIQVRGVRPARRAGARNGRRRPRVVQPHLPDQRARHELSLADEHYLDLDPTYKDAIGRPLTRTTFNYSDNDRKMSVFLTNKVMEIARAANAK